MNKNWKFFKGSVDDGASVTLNDSEWETVNLGHTWNNIDGQDGTPNAKDINDTDYFRGDGWYRKHMSFEKSDADKNIYLRFLGVNIQCEVYVNGKLAGAHKGGYTAFNVDITPYVNFNDENIIAVRVNNERTEEIAPITADFTFYGGIYRGVELIKKNKIRFDFGKYDAKELKLTTPSVTNEKATCVFDAVIVNDTDEPQELNVNASLVSACDFRENTYIQNVDFDNSPKQSVSGTIITQERTVVIEPNSCKEIRFTFEIENPHLWNGRQDPHLYKGKVCISCKGKVLDEAFSAVGFRYFNVDYKKGFFLNGKSYPLRGVSRHQDREDLGNALTEKEHDEDFALIYDMGVTAIRLAHYPQAEYFYDMCDRYGIVVWAEIPFVDEVGGSGEYNSPDKTRNEFFNTTKNQLRELINQNFNHPSIVCWGLQNEVKAKHDSVMIPFMDELYKIGKEEDPYRLLTQATNQTTAFNWKSDLMAWNIYPGWYGMSRNQLGWWLDKYTCDRPMAISEYGAGGNHLQHDERPKKPQHDGQFHPEEYQTLCHEAFIKQIDKRPQLWATFVWNMFDFGSDGRMEGNRPGMNDKGLVSFDRKTKKDSYYVYQSAWSKHPMVQIGQARNTERKHLYTTIKVYSNCEGVTLYNNDKKIKTKSSSSCSQKGIYKFFVKLNKGKNDLVAKATSNGKEYESKALFKFSK